MNEMLHHVVSGPLPKGAGVGVGVVGGLEEAGGSTGPASPHLLVFLGKKVRSKLWSQRRIDRDRRDLLGGCG